VARDSAPTEAGSAAPADTGAERRKRRRQARTGRRPRGGGKAARERTNGASVATHAPESADGAKPAPPLTTRPLRAIEPPATGLRGYFAEAWRHRAAFSYFVFRFARKMYGRTFFGYLWFVLPYVISLFLGTLVFGGILGVSVPGIPYFLYFCVTTGVWLLFSQTAYRATRSLEISRSEIKRLYVPRLLPLAASVTLPITAFAFYTLIMAGTVGFYVLTRGEFYLAIRPATLLAPCGLVMLVVLAWTSGLWFSTLAPRARDVRRLAGYVLAFWYFLTPIIYPVSKIPSQYQFLASLNPATAPIELVKDGLLDIGHVTSLGLAVYFGMLIAITIGGLLIFIPKERRDVAFY
jgi:lipopolysaccharide transport system permease protein